MNIRPRLIAASLVAAFVASPAFAQEATPDTWTEIASTTTRAEVRAEATTALRAGLTGHGEVTHAPVDFQSVKTREQVREIVFSATPAYEDRAGETPTPAQHWQVNGLGSGRMGAGSPIPPNRARMRNRVLRAADARYP